jgi:hypothetical protein
MKHAGPAALDTLEPFLDRLRAFEGLKEKKRGIFYRRGKSFVHFHEDPAGLFADIAAPGGDLRLPVTLPEDQQAALVRIEALLRTAT